ncbi:MAG: hypothetical protein AB8G22_05440 [Saprospiraceae bacterium]
MENFTIYTPYIIGLIILYYGLFLKFNPPQAINKRINLPISPSRLNLDTFQTACRYLAKWMMIIGSLALIFGVAINQIALTNSWVNHEIKSWNILAAVLCSTLPILAILIGVSTHLNRLFNRNGIRKNT